MKQHQKKKDTKKIKREDIQDTPAQNSGVHSPDTQDASSSDTQESEYGSRSYASPDFFKKKPGFS